MQKNPAKPLKLLFFGLGSIGKRHAAILNKKFDVELYAFRSKTGQKQHDLSIHEFSTLEEAFSIKPDIAFITNPTYLHVPTALECARRNISLFIEKPLSHSLDQLDKLGNEIKKQKLFTYIAYNMRFHPVLNYLKKVVSTGEQPIYFRIICSSYLPKWRPKQNYEHSYSAQKNYGGGVILDLSHEFDYIVWLFDELKKITGYCRKISNLQINCEDLTEAQITCAQNLHGTLHLDYFSVYNERKIQLYYNTKYIEGDLLKNTVTTIKKNKKPQIIKYENSPDDMYVKQLQYFFEQYNKKNLQNMNNFSEALKTFRKIMEFKKKYCAI